MNKNMFLTLAFMVSGVTSSYSMQLSAREEQERIEQIRNLSRHGALNQAQYWVNGRIDNNLLLRDIELFEKDSANALSKKSWAQGYLYSSIMPAFGKLVGFGSGLGALAAGAAAGVSGNAFYEVWNSYKGVNAADWIAEKVVEGTSSDFFERTSKLFDYYRMRRKFLYDIAGKQRRSILDNAPAVMVAGTMGALMLAGISKYIFNKVSKYNTKNALLVQELQEQYEQDQVIIAQLKQIQYDVSRGR
jgi:hypothetical protein